MVVDESSEDTELLRHHLEQVLPDAPEIIPVEDRYQALRRIAECGPDAIFVGFGQDDRAGLEVVEAIREAGEVKPLIVMTTQGTEESATTLLRAGADDYLLKGRLSPQVLRRSLKHAEAQHSRRRAENELAHKNALLSQTLQREREISRQLQEAKASAEEATRLKSEFLANMSHEIRTPMTAILGFTDMVLEDGDLSKIPRDRLAALLTIKRNGEYLLELINDILDLSKIEANQLSVEKITFSPVEIVDDVRDLMRMRGEAKGITFEVEYQGALPDSITSDPTRLRQILINLVGNAIKFTEVGGVVLSVRRATSESGPAAQFEVIDSGIGMSEEQLARVFQPFTQADSSTTRKYGGTGLGLTVCKRLADLLGATIGAESELGGGSTFSLTLPLGDAAIAETAETPARIESVSGQREERHEDVRAVRIDARILLAEDGPDNQRLIGHVLRKAGAEVTLAENGRLAVDLVLAAGEAAEPFDLVLMDLQMPELDGWDATRALRDHGYEGPIIALTAHAMAAEQERCLADGFSAIATKPLDRTKLLDLICDLIRKARTEP
jgi:Amt family ammonium transporter